MTPNSVAFLSPVVIRRLVHAAHSDARVDLTGFLFASDGREEYEAWSTVIDLNVNKTEQGKAVRSALMQAAKTGQFTAAKPTIRFSHFNQSGCVHMSLWLYGSPR